MDETRTILDAAVEHLPAAGFSLNPAVDGFRPTKITINHPHSTVKVETAEDLLLEPLRIRQTATFENVASFADYVNAFANRPSGGESVIPAGGGSRIFASLEARKVIARLDYHAPGKASWQTHSAVLPVAFDVSFAAWQAVAGRKLSQGDFAHFLEERAEDAVIPDPATLVEIASNFQAIRNVDFRSAINVGTGERQFRYEEKDAPGGGITVPKLIKLHTPVFYDTPAVDWVARFAYDITDGKLFFTVKIHRERELLDREFGYLVESVEEACAPVPVHRGCTS